jgi:4-hydroxy-tetrahydrodipicolinate synthase
VNKEEIMEIKGTYTALVTPFTGEEIDFTGLRKNISFQIENKVDGLLVLGTTGEAPTITAEEQDEIIRTAIDEIHGRAPLMVGTGVYSTAKTIENTRKAKEAGADIALIVTPYYNKPTDEGIYRHFKAVSDNVDFPVMVYNIQGRTSKNIETGTLKRIAELRNIIGVKEASGNINQMEDVIQNIAQCKNNFTVMSGDDSLTLPLIALGGKGVISVVSNLLPEKVVQMVNAALNGDFYKARKLHYELLPVFKGAFIETNPIPIKAAMNLAGMPAGSYRLPICEMTQANKIKLENILREMKII